MKRLLPCILLLILSTSVASADLQVYAASSLREAFIKIGQLYEKQYGKKVSFNFAGSQTLRTQIEFGAPADLYAAADLETMMPLASKNLVGPVHFFAGNNLLVLLSKKRSSIKKLPDLADNEVQIAIGNSHVPVGKYTRQLLAGIKKDPASEPGLVDGIWSNVRTQESSVKAIVSKVLLDEVDAGIVYRTDLTFDTQARTAHIELPEKHNPLVRYPTAVISSSRQSKAAQGFINLLLAPAGQKILQDYRFLPAATGVTK